MKWQFRGTKTEWHKWYAWRPVRLTDNKDGEENTWVWLETVTRRYSYYHDMWLYY